MKKVNEVLIQKIYQKTDGKCHLCNNSIAFSNYGKQGCRGAWEIDHSRPRVRGGTDNLNNLFPAHISCNRIKRDRNKHTIRQQLGYRKSEESLGMGEILTGIFGLIAALNILSNNRQIERR